jgi:preprotein translocase subunit SecD
MPDWRPKGTGMRFSAGLVFAFCLAGFVAGGAAQAEAQPAGIHAVFEIDLKTWWHDQIEEYSYSVRGDGPEHVLGPAARTIDDQGITLHYDDPHKLAADRDYLAPLLAARENPYVVSQPSPDTLLLSPAPDNRRATEDRLMARSLAMIEARFHAVTQKAVQAVRVGTNRIAVTIPEASDPTVFATVTGAVQGLTFQQVDEEVSEANLRAGHVPRGDTILPMAGSVPPLQPLAVRNEVLMRGDRVLRAISAIDENSGEPVVLVYLDKIGAVEFARMTKAIFFGRLAVIVDGSIVTAPMVREPILGGQLQIDGAFTPEQAAALALRLSPGGMPAPVRLVSSGLETSPQ